MVEPGANIKQFSTYAFAEVDKAKDDARSRGFRIIDFGVGDPTEPLYDGAIKGAIDGARKYARSGYPSYIGMEGFRTAASSWLKSRFGIDADPATQITTTAGSKEAVFHFPFAFLNKGDAVLMPSIGYPPYKSGTVFAGGSPEFYGLREENNFLPDIGEIEDKLRANSRIKIIWINYPNNPTTVMADQKFFNGLIELSKKHNVIIASDEAYTEMYKDSKPHTILEFADDWSNMAVFQSLSKRSNATGLRVGFAVGGAEIIRNYRILRTQIDSGVANMIQEAGAEALKDEKHVQEMRKIYNERRRIMTEVLESKGIRCWSEATLYVWAKVNGDSMAFAKEMIRIDGKDKVGINVTPGAMLALDKSADAGKFVRFALVPSTEDTEYAARILEKTLK